MTFRKILECYPLSKQLYIPIFSFVSCIFFKSESLRICRNFNQWLFQKLLMVKHEVRHWLKLPKILHDSNFAISLAEKKGFSISNGSFLIRSKNIHSIKKFVDHC